MTEVLFNGHAGRLEGRYHQSDKPGAPIALILHPHPQYGGTMNNKVVYTLFSCFQNLGFSVLIIKENSTPSKKRLYENRKGYPCSVYRLRCSSIHYAVNRERFSVVL